MRHDELIAHVRGIAAKMATHQHDDGDLFCLSRAAWIGERSYRIIEHVDALEAELADLRAKLARAEADAAEVARVAGVESPAHVDDVTAAIAEMLDKEARAEAAEVALERVAFERDRVVRERDEAHRGWLLAKSLAMGFSESSERAAARALAEIESATAGAALLREVEAGRALREFPIDHKVDCAIQPGAPCDCGRDAALADYDAARGAR